MVLIVLLFAEDPKKGGVKSYLMVLIVLLFAEDPKKGGVKRGTGESWDSDDELLQDEVTPSKKVQYDELYERT